MRKAWLHVGVASLVVSAASLAVGCIDFVAEYYTPLTNPALADGGTDGGDAGHDGGTDGGDSGPPPRASRA